MQIRNYHPADRESVIALWNTVFPNQTGRNDPDRAIDRKLAVDDGLFFVAVNEDGLVGTVMAGYDGHRGWVYSVAVDPGGQRNGVGTALVRHAEEVLTQLGCPKINLQVLADNAAVVAFYEALDYRVEERISMGKILDDEIAPQ